MAIEVKKEPDLEKRMFPDTTYCRSELEAWIGEDKPDIADTP